jgi:hypothetical protein
MDAEKGLFNTNLQEINILNVSKETFVSVQNSNQKEIKTKWFLCLIAFQNDNL